MKKLILLSSCALLAATAVAETKVYSTDLLGELNGISANGRYAVASDADNARAYLWNVDNPDEWKDITPARDETLPTAQQLIGAEVYGVTDDGMAVGCVYYGDHMARPAIWNNGEWIDLPIHPSSMSTNSAVAVTADGSVVGGYMFINDPSADIQGHYYPCRWVRDEYGGYTLEAYTDIELPDHQGFFPTGMSPDGSTIAGMVFCGVQSTVPAMVRDGQLTIFADIDTKYEPFMWNGKYETRDEDGKQGWTTDPDDPNIVLYPETYIDGIKDTGENPFTGRFSRIDWSGHIYGCRDLVSDVDDEGNGKLTPCATFYDMNSEEWSDDTGYKAYSTGLEGRILFAGTTRVIIDGRATTITSEFGFSAPRMIVSVNCTSRDGQVLGAMTAQMNDATGEYDYFPLVIVLDEPLVEVTGTVEVADGNDVAVAVADGRILVTGASDVTVYDTTGRLVSAAADSRVAPGIYIVNADGASYKVIVK